MVPCHVLMLTYAIIKFRLMDIRIAVTRAGIFLCVYTLVLGVPFWMGIHRGFDISSTIVMGLLSSIGPLLYSKIQKKAESILLAQQRRYQEVLLQASVGMMKEYDIDRLVKVMVHTVKRAVGIRYVSAYLFDASSSSYQLRSERGKQQCVTKGVFNETDQFVVHMLSIKEPFTYEELPEDIRQELKGSVQFNLVVPAFLDGKLIGFLMLGDKLDRKPYSQEDIDAFKTLVNQFSMAVRLDELRQEIKRTERLKMMGEMSSILGHEIRNPLSAIKVAVFLLRHYLKKTPEAVASLQKPTDILEKEIESMQILIDNTLDFTRTREPVLQHRDITEIVRREMDIAQAHPHIEARLELKSSSLVVLMDVEEIKQVLRNLINNAIDSMKGKEKGALGVVVSEGTFEKDGKMIASAVVEISDTGCGIPSENLQKIFESFFSTKSKGTGLGLAVVKKIIEERHRGAISVTSTVGIGTTFQVMIPI